MAAVSLRWIASSSASAFHAAEAIARGQTLIDATVAETIATPVAALGQCLNDRRLAQAPFWEHIHPLAAGIESNRELAEVLLRKIGCQTALRSAVVDELTGVFADLENAYRRALPGLADELQLRSAPLREQWEARGGGLLKEFGRLTQIDLVVERADVLLVHPVLGGGGAAHLPYNACRMEAVLANPHFQLPEVVRLGWLLAQLHNDLPANQGNLSRQQIAEVGALAAILPILEAAQEVELARSDDTTLQLALAAWHAGEPNLASTLSTWWSVYQQDRPPWHIALAALERMLAALQQPPPIPDP